MSVLFFVLLFFATTSYILSVVKFLEAYKLSEERCRKYEKWYNEESSYNKRLAAEIGKLNLEISMLKRGITKNER